MVEMVGIETAGATMIETETDTETEKVARVVAVMIVIVGTATTTAVTIETTAVAMIEMIATKVEEGKVAESETGMIAIEGQ